MSAYDMMLSIKISLRDLHCLQTHWGWKIMSMSLNHKHVFGYLIQYKPRAWKAKYLLKLTSPRVGIRAALQSHREHRARATNGEAGQNHSRSYVSPSWGWKLLLWSHVNLNNKNQSQMEELRELAYPDTYKGAAQSVLSWAPEQNFHVLSIHIWCSTPRRAQGPLSTRFAATHSSSHADTSQIFRAQQLEHTQCTELSDIRPWV